MTPLDLPARFDALRPRLRGVAYRILGSLSEADDAVQEAWLRLERSDTAGIRNLDVWLTTVVTRIALNLLRARRPSPDAFVPEPLVTAGERSDPEHDALLADRVGMALQVVLETLGPAERVAFVLHDFFEVPFAEIATLLERTPDAVRQLASRARRQVRDNAPSPDAELGAQRAAVDAYFAAARQGDLDALVAVLAPDVVLRAHRRGEAPQVLRGAQQVSRGAMAARHFATRVRPALVNGSAGVVAYAEGVPFAVLAFAVTAGLIVAIDIFNDPEFVPRLVR